ncbi:hypothetical protein, partial [Staphylococcus aureus]|uniref:hypothetical protein n=1 Tax=Staphylococcus aureus TaxID=1280 RepID=UPI001A9E398B
FLCVGALTPTCTLLKADYWPASVLGPRQLALSVEFLFEILYVGAPPIIEKCLLHGHFHSVNYYQYNIVEPKTLIYYVLGSIPSFND